MPIRSVGIALAIVVAGCARAPRGPEVAAPEAPALFAAFNGSWTLVPRESNSPEPGAGRGRRRGGDTGFLPPAGGGRGGVGGGRGVPGGGGGRGIPGGGGGGRPIPGGDRDGGRPIPAGGTLGGPGEGLAMLAVLPALDLTVTDSTLAVEPRAAEPDSTGAEPAHVWPRPDGYRLRLDGKEASIARVQATARWSGRAIEIERKIEDGPEVKELWSVDEATGRLIVTREIDVPRGGKVERRQVYRRTDPSGARR